MIVYGVMVGRLYLMPNGGFTEDQADAQKFKTFYEVENIRNKWVKKIPALADVICALLWLDDE